MLTKIKNIKLRRETKNQKGFTLVELMATLGILALIVAIAVPAIGSIMGKAQDQAHDADVAMVEDAAAIAFASESTGGTPTITTPYSVKDLIDAGYLDIDAPTKGGNSGDRDPILPTDTVVQAGNNGSFELTPTP